MSRGRVKKKKKKPMEEVTVTVDIIERKDDGQLLLFGAEQRK